MFVFKTLQNEYNCSDRFLELSEFTRLREIWQEREMWAQWQTDLPPPIHPALTTYVCIRVRLRTQICDGESLKTYSNELRNCMPTNCDFQHGRLRQESQ